VPADRTSTYYQYRVRLVREELGLGHLEATVVRDALGKALQAAGVGVEIWHRVPAPAFPVFQDRAGFGGAFPWTQPPASREVTYDLADFPEATALLDSSLVICDARHPIFIQPSEVIEAYADVIREVLADAQRVVDEAGLASAVPT
jgi:hypothetical protein